MEQVTLTRNSVYTVHKTGTDLAGPAAKYGGEVVLTETAVSDPPAEGWSQSVAVFFDARKAGSYSRAVRRLEGVAETQRRAEKVAYLPLDVEAFTTERSGRLRMVLRGKTKGTFLTPEHEKDGLVFGLVGQTHPVPRYFRKATGGAPEAPVAELEAGA